MSSGSKEHIVKKAILKKELYRSAAAMCDWVEPRELKKTLLKGVSEDLRHVSQELKEKSIPQPEFLRAVTEAFCVSRNFNKAVTLASSEQPPGGFERNPVETSALTDLDDLAEDPEMSYSGAENMARSNTFPTIPVLSFAVGAVFGAFLTHYNTLLGRSAPAPKGLRRPEL